MLGEDTKSIDSSEYDSISLTESLEGSPSKMKKKKKLMLFRRKKHKHEKTSNTVSVEKDTDQYSVSSSFEASSSHLERQFYSDMSDSQTNLDQINGNGALPQGVADRPTNFSKGSLKKSPAIGPETHKLHIRLRGGEHLAARDTNGLSDPYVKFKVGGRTAYKSKVCKRTLEPRWDEEFEIPVHLHSDVRIRVYDKDFTSRDDFMGGGRVDLKRLSSIANDFEDITIELQDPETDEELGYIHFEARLISLFPESSPIKESTAAVFERTPSGPSPDSIERTKASKSSFRQRNSSSEKTVPAKVDRPQNTKQVHAKQSTVDSPQKTATFSRSNRPVATATLQLVSGTDIPARDTNGLSDPYVKLGLSKTKRKKSKVCYKTLSPVWKEEFTFYLSSPDTSLLEISVWDKDNYRKDDFIGRCELDLWSLDREETHSLCLSLVDTPGTLHVLVTVHSVEAPEVPVTRYDLSEIRLKYGLTSTFENLADVGFAEVRIVSASGLRSADMNGKSDPFCVAHLCNARAQTHTCYRTLDPVWNRVFTFPIRDIHDVFDFLVFDQDQNCEKEFLGRFCIPILRCANGEVQTYLLKDRKLKERAKGSLTLQISYIFNPVRSAIRTFSPREEILMEESSKFKKAILSQNFSRVWGILQHIFTAAEFINSCFTWNNKLRSATAFLMFLLIVWNFELYMVPLVLLMLMLKNYVDIYIRKIRPPRHLMNAEEARRAGTEDDEDEEENSGKLSFLQKLRAIEEVLTKVQVILDTIASMGERVYNTFAWSVPFLGWLLVIVLCIFCLVLYFIPLRTIVLLWGINKFTKRLRKPNFVPNNEVMDYLSRIPSNVQLDENREFQLESSPTHNKKKR